MTTKLVSAESATGAGTAAGVPETPRRSGIGIRARAMAVIVAVMIALGLASSGAASAVAVAGGVQFTSTVSCGELAGLEVGVQSNSGSGGWAMVYLQDAVTGAWVTGQWHSISGYTLISNEFTINRSGYFNVYVYYAQGTNAGFAYNGDYIHNYLQGSAGGYGTDPSATCLL
jgi:hypothetical protein